MIGNKRLKNEYKQLEEKYMKLFGEKSELEYELSSLKENAEYIRKQDNEIQALHQSMRQLKHDMKNHLMVIASYINDEDYKEAKSYASKIIGKLNAIHSYIETGNSLMNHVINEKLEQARNNGIVIKAEIENLQFKTLESIDFSALLTNMMDNALEASMMEEEKDRELHIFITKQRGYDTICVKNRIKKSVIDCNPNLNTTKDNKDIHGIGVGKIKSIVDSCEGMCDIYEEDGFFCVKVFIPE